MIAGERLRLRDLHRADDADPAEVLARIGWSVVAEPGDAVAGLVVDGLGAARALRLLDEADAPELLLDALLEVGAVAEPDRADVGAALVTALARWSPRLTGLDVAHTIAMGAAVGARLLVPGDPAWPAGLDDLGPSAPFVLWSRSRSGAGTGCAAVGVVGSRANTTYGAEVAAEIASAATTAGLVVLSGGAYGIDAVAHRVAVAAHGTTVAVLAGGVDQFYPAGNADLLRTVSQTGSVLAESPPGVRPTRWRFLARNRLIAAMSGSVAVVEAGARSGALNTAHHAGQLGRPVFAVPGPITSTASIGCHRLVADGRATVMVRVHDPVDAVLSEPGSLGTGQVALGGTNDDPALVRVLDAVGRRRPEPLAEVARRSGMSIEDTADALALAELQGRVRRSADGWRSA